MTDYDRFKKDHPEMLKMAEEHLEELEQLSAALKISWDELSKARVLLRRVDERIKQDPNGNLEHDWACRSTHDTGRPCDCGHEELKTEIRACLERGDET